MTRRASLSAEIEFSVTLSAQTGDSPTSLTGALRGNESDLELTVSDLQLLGDIGARRSVSAANLAGALANRGVRLRIADNLGPVMTVGAVSSNWLQRLLSSSWHIRVHRLRALVVRRRLRKQGRLATSTLPLSSLVPPLPSSGVIPLAPAFLHPRRRPVTMTHDSSGGGDPRLIFSVGQHAFPGEQPRIFYLVNDVTTIGSHPSADLCLQGLAPWHAEIRRDENDEYVLVQQVASGDEEVPEAREPELTMLRTGRRIELGGWSMSYFRAEYADHGRPYGGRQGGELGHQRPQPPRQRSASSPSSTRPSTDRGGI